jgi:hypothetical protein
MWENRSSECVPKKLTQENNGAGWKTETARREVINPSRFHLDTDRFASRKRS